MPTSPGEEDIADRIWEEAAAVAAGHQAADMVRPLVRDSVIDFAERLRNPPALRQSQWVEHQPAYRPMARRPVDRRWHPWQSKGRVGKGGAYEHYTMSPLCPLNGDDDLGPGSPGSTGSQPSYNPRALGSMLGKTSSE